MVDSPYEASSLRTIIATTPTINVVRSFANLCISTAVADKFGEDTTAKAVSTRFERMKKEPGWLTNNPSGSNGTPNGNGATTAKAKATPRKKKAPAGSSNSDDEEEFKYTPTKSAMNRTQGGRITKPKTPSKNGSFAGGMMPIEVGSDDENNIKMEHNGNGNGYAMPLDDVSDDEGGKFYEADNGYLSDGEAV
jgi:hypothetical protein